MTDPARPRVLVSRCLGFEACRWDGGIVACDPVARLGAFCEVLTRCPEADMGLGTPRPPIRLILLDGEARLFEPDGSRDLTGAMNAYAARTLDEIGPLDGVVLKSRSPSCGRGDVKVFADAASDAVASIDGTGLFARAVVERLGDVAFESEDRLEDAAVFECFRKRILASALRRRTSCAGSVVG